MNDIHPSAVIQGDVKLGRGNVILPFTNLIGPLEIGDRNIIGPHVVIGSPGADTRNPRYDSSNRKIEIGSDNIIREFSAIQKPCYRDITKIGNNVFIMQGASISHDVIIQDEVVVTANVSIAGIAQILKGANLAMGSTVNQFALIGQYSILGMASAAVKNVKPFSRYIPGKALTVNEYAVKKFGFEDCKTEIENYVLRMVMPLNPRLLAIVTEFEALHKDSGRPLYGVVGV